ncbi:hypothetical protein ANAPH1_00952 [Anaplasma phagocytophilum]|nr:hypothetical protein ANAPH1_00952 [Anaplasma phagocytophilum]
MPKTGIPESISTRNWSITGSLISAGSPGPLDITMPLGFSDNALAAKSFCAATT